MIGSRLTSNYGGDGFVQGILKVFEKEGLEYEQLKDSDLTNITASLTQNTEQFLQSAPEGPLTLVDYSDFGVPVLQPVLEKENRLTETAVITRYEDPSAIKIAESGLEVLFATTESFRHTFKAVEALIAYWTEEKPLQVEITEPGGASTRSANGPRAKKGSFDFPAALEKQEKIWAQKYVMEG